MEKKTDDFFGKKVEILVSTYNGEKYLREQLDSLVNLEGLENIKISIRDDGSIDGTINILKSYGERYKLDITYGSNIGVNASMLTLVNNSDCSYDYFAFCDQDDIWFTDRIKLAVKALNNENQNIPLMWGCREEVVDGNLEKISAMPIPKHCGLFYNALIQNGLAGHVQVMNKTLVNLLKNIDSDKIVIYDWFSYIVVSAFGKVLYEEKICGKYRQHGNNTVGHETAVIFKFFKRMKRLVKGEHKGTTEQNFYFYKLFYESLKTEYRLELKNFFDGFKNIFCRLKYVANTKLIRATFLETLYFKILYFSGAYGKKNPSNVNFKELK